MAPTPSFGEGSSMAPPLDGGHHCQPCIFNRYGGEDYQIQPGISCANLTRGHTYCRSSRSAHGRSMLRVGQRSDHILEPEGSVENQPSGGGSSPHPCASFNTILPEPLCIFITRSKKIAWRMTHLVFCIFLTPHSSFTCLPHTCSHTVCSRSPYHHEILFLL